MLHDSQLGKGLLEELKVGHELVLELSFPVDFGNGYFGGVEDVDELAIGGSCAKLFDFGEVDLEEVVEPVEELSSGHLYGVVGVDGHLVYHRFFPNCYNSAIYYII